MIIGIGNDLVEIKRIAEIYERFGSRFLDRVFTREEQEKAQQRPDIPAFLAKRFAAKEACAKALGTGLNMQLSPQTQAIHWCDIEIVNLPSGRPALFLHNGAKARLWELTPQGKSPSIHLSLTDDAGLAQAFVIISAD